jgi:hypothetical protein
MDLGLYDHRAKLFDSGQIGNHSQTLATNLFIVDLDHIVDERVDQLRLHHFVLWVCHQEFLIVEENIGEAAENGGDKFLHKVTNTAQR